VFSAQDFLIRLAEGKTELEAIPALALGERASNTQKAATAAD
jgi:hypothetical protein